MVVAGPGAAGGEIRAWRGECGESRRGPVGVLVDTICIAFSSIYREQHLTSLPTRVGAQRIETLAPPPDRVDPVVNQMGAAIVDAMQEGQLECRLFLDHALFALHAHFARVYGGMRIDGNSARGGLAPRQMRRAEEFS